MADISHLGTLQPLEPIDLDLYPAAQQGTFPKKGRYTLRAPERIGDEAFSASQSNYLKAQIDPVIVGPSHNGYVVRYVSLSAKPYKRTIGRRGTPNEKVITVSQLGDYLRACGIKGVLPTDPAALADLVERTAGATFLADLDWRARNKNTGREVRGMENFPSDGNGGHLPWFTDPDDLDPETKEPRRVRAFLEIVRFVPAQ